MVVHCGDIIYHNIPFPKAQGPPRRISSAMAKSVGSAKDSGLFCLSLPGPDFQYYRRVHR